MNPIKTWWDISPPLSTATPTWPSAMQEWQAGNPTAFEGCTSTFRDAARLLGVTQALGLDATHDNLKSVENAA